MIRRILYAAWAAAALAGAAWAQYTGWTIGPARQSSVTPQSIRDNPGAYRSPYFIPGRILRGK